MKHVISLLAVAALSAAIALPVMAEGRHEGRGGEHHVVRGWGGERDIRHFESRHYPVWRSGIWRHERHDGRFGWWWVVAGTWYFYPAPIYPYPDPYIPPYIVVRPAPQPAVPVTQPPAQYWYYCDASKNYYPYVSTCPGGWREVPATPPGTQVNTPPR